MSYSIDEFRSALLEGDLGKLDALCRGALREDSADLHVRAYGAYVRCGAVLEQYLEDTARLLKDKHSDNSARTFLNRVFLGKDEFYTDQVHEKYYKDMETATGALAKAIRALPAGDADGKRLAAAAIRLLIRKDPGDRKEMRFLLSADDTYAVPFAALASPGDLATLAAEFEADYPRKRDRLPNQETLLQKMRALANKE